MFRQRIPSFLLSTLLASAGVIQALPARDASAGSHPREIKRTPREVPEDPPGTPARPVPGARRAAPVRLGAFVSIQVNVDEGGANIPGDAANEPSIAVDPTFPNRMAIGGRQFDTVTSNFRQAGWAYTRDGGRTWTFPGVLDPGVFRSDPVLSFDAEGAFYYSSLEVVGGSYSCDVFKSTNGGLAWGPEIYAYGGDKQWITVDRTGSIGHGHIYTAWSTAAGCCGRNTFNRSINGGHIFEPPVSFPVAPIWGTLDVASDGTVYICGTDDNQQTLFLFTRSTNARDPLATPTYEFTTAVDLNGIIMFGGTSPNPGGLLGQVWIAADNSGGPTSGYIYMMCTVGPPGPDPMDVHFARSTDGGNTWSAPVRINDDPTTNGAWQWFGTMSVAPNGRIDVVWNDTRNTGVYNQSELFYAYSTDGGVTWSPNEQLSPAWNSHVGWPNQNKIGDYYDMVSDDVGASLAWAATFNGEQDVYYLRIGDYDCNTNGVPDSVDLALGTSPDKNENGIPDECELGTTAVPDGDPLGYRLHQNTPNPFNPWTTIEFDVPSGGGRIRLQIFDVRGRLVRTLVEGFRSAGGNRVEWDGKDGRGRVVASGLYFYRLEAPGFAETKKMMLLR